MKTYKTILGDTWDAISYKLFQSNVYADKLQKWNPQYTDVGIFGANNPILYEDIEPTDYASIAPWRR